MTETLQLGGLGFEVRRSGRRKTLCLTVDRAGELVAHVPSEASVEELTHWINKRLLWVHRKLALKEEAAPKMRAPEYVSGEAFCYVRDLGYRWGSCGKSGVVFFNWKILQLPVPLVDYIIMHELVHLVEGHHGPAFWQALGRAMPDWQKRKDALADKAKEYLVFGMVV